MKIKKYFVKSSLLEKRSFPNKTIIEMTKKMSKTIKYKKELFFWGRMIFIISFLKHKLIIMLETKSITIIKD